MLQITWKHDLPIAKVYSVVDGAIFRVSLLHRSYQCRYGIGIGSTLRVSMNRFIIHGINPVRHDHQYPNTESVFNRWFLFRKQLKPHLSPSVAKKLFLRGIETVDELRRRVHEVQEIRGIGPVAATRIRQMLLTHVSVS